MEEALLIDVKEDWYSVPMRGGETSFSTGHGSVRERTPVISGSKTLCKASGTGGTSGGGGENDGSFGQTGGKMPGEEGRW